MLWAFFFFFKRDMELFEVNGEADGIEFKYVYGRILGENEVQKQNKPVL